MPIATVFSRGERGIQAPLVTVETHLTNGTHRFNIVGLPEKAVKESKDRVRSAIMNSNFEFPNRIITVNLAPAELPKEGGRFDLAIALSILAASRQLPQQALNNVEIAGELGLTGELRAIAGVIPFALATQQSQRILVLPTGNCEAIHIIGDLSYMAANHLTDVCGQLIQQQCCTTQPLKQRKFSPPTVDIAEVKGQYQGKRVLEIAAAGGHNLLMVGPPGTGKTLLASCLPSLLPPLSAQQALEVAAIHSICPPQKQAHHWLTPPLRQPHHTASSAALVGGGNPPKPGDISLAHHGVLFLDEFPEFNRTSLESLREPLESGKILLSRAGHHREYPAKFQLIAAMNPCPCGHQGNPQGHCRCTQEQIQRYRHRLSGPLLDRIDMTIQILPISATELFAPRQQAVEDSATVQQRVKQAREQQEQRQQRLNRYLSGDDLQTYCQLSSSQENFFIKAIESLGLSSRAIHRTLRVARTIADLDQTQHIEQHHLTESLSYRSI